MTYITNRKTKLQISETVCPASASSRAILQRASSPVMGVVRYRLSG